VYAPAARVTSTVSHSWWRRVCGAQRSAAQRRGGRVAGATATRGALAGGARLLAQRAARVCAHESKPRRALVANLAVSARAHRRPSQRLRAHRAVVIAHRAFTDPGAGRVCHSRKLYRRE
jgi:hypothetical protein